MKGENKTTTIFIVVTQAIMMALSTISSLKHLGSKYAFYITVGFFVFYLIYTLFTQNKLMLKLLIFGTFAGLLELWADHYSVATIGALIYPSGELMIISSPAYMPLSWAIALTQLGYYSLLLIKQKGLGIATIVMALAGALYIPMYENLAKEANWWYYQNVKMLGNAPYYIILCEALVSLLLPVSVYYFSNRKLSWAIVLGILIGFWILVSAMISFSIFS